MGKIFFMREAFITGDNLVQGLPWLKVYADSIRSARFPFWVTGIHCGFPLIGEGQVGGFYPLNLLFFFFLPFEFAYNYSVLFHLLVAGIATYFVARKLGAGLMGGLLASIVLCFGSAFSNIGYHLAMIRSLSLFPLGILLLEYYFNKENRKFLFFLAVVMTFQLLSGSVQTAVYSFILYFVYLISGVYVHKLSLRHGITGFLKISLIPVICFLPQLFLTLKVINYSGRIASLDFALWGSLNPLSIFTFYFPAIFRFKGQIMTEDFFLGSLSVLFILSALKDIKWDRALRPAVFTGAAAVFFALGWFNPLYIMLLKILRLYTFRAPARFVFFFVFSCSLLAGAGFTRFFGERFSVRVACMKTFMRTVYICLTAVAAGAAILVAGKDFVIRIGQSFVERFIEGTPYHRYDIVDYYAKIDAVYTSMVNSVMFSGKNILISLFFILSAIAFCYFLIAKKISLRRKKNRFICEITALLLIITNLWCYKFFPGGYKENTRHFSYIEPGGFSTIFDKIKKEGADYRILPFNIKKGQLPVWSIPNVNMYFGLDSVAVYSPLASRIYYSKLKDFQVVDDSIGLKKPLKNFDTDNLNLLRMLNVKYIISSEELSSDAFNQVLNEDKLFVYELESTLKKVFFSEDIEGSEIYDENIRIINFGEGYVETDVYAKKEGYLVFSQQYFPGWEVFVDGQRSNILVFNELFMAVKIKKGESTVIFKYNIFSKK
jgi:hypothetical protein